MKDALAYGETTAGHFLPFRNSQNIGFVRAKMAKSFFAFAKNLKPENLTYNDNRDKKKPSEARTTWVQRWSMLQFTEDVLVLIVA